MDLRTETIESRLCRYNNAGPGFDVLRLGLSLLIFYGHARGIAGIEKVISDASLQTDTVSLEHNSVLVFLTNIRHRLFAIYVPMFFALSGFLVTGSALRLRNARPFLAFRALRIFPALTVEVTLSAFLLGVCFTSLTTPEYFKDPAFRTYLLNVLGIVHFSLPGVFLNSNPPYAGIVNANLWTLPAEFYCYVITMILMLTGVLYRRTFMILIFFTASTGLFVKFTWFLAFQLDRIATLDLIVYYFFAGMIFYLWRDKILLSPWLFALCTAVVAMLFQVPHLAVFMPLPLTYATVYFGCIGFKYVDNLRRHDVSYGIYLYGFPITQATMLLVPDLGGHPILLSITSLVTTIIFATLSWRYIEKPALRLKRFLV